MRKLMVDYERYQQLMDEAHDTLEQAAAALMRTGLSAEVREDLNNDLVQKAAQLRKRALTFVLND